MKLGRFIVAGALVAAASAAQAYPKSCNEVWLQGHYTDGEYVIEPTPGVVFSVYCRGLATGTPAEYLTLVNTGGDFNFGQISAGGSFTGTNVRTSFTKIRIDSKTLLVDIADRTYATSTGSVTQTCCGPNVGTTALTSASYGVAAGCYSGAANGVANIDLTGTPFLVHNIFATEGYNPRGAVNGVPLAANAVSTVVDAAVVNVTGGGYCGATGPEGFNSSVNYWLYSSLNPRLVQTALQLRYAP